MTAASIRPATSADWPAMWPIFRTVIAGGDTYVFAPETGEAEGRAYWFGAGIASYVIEKGGRLAGMYKIVANQRDLGNHVANASFMVDPAAAGRGLGKTMGEHALAEAKRLGFSAMQFNFVVSTNTGAVKLWQRLGFKIVGTLPKAFRHQELGPVDAYVMFRTLDEVGSETQSR